MIEGERVHVKTRYFNGMATILAISPGEIYPIQVALDQADEDGHKTYRIATHEIQHEAPAEKQLISFSGPKDPQQYLGRLIQKNGSCSYQIGQEFILGVVAYPGVHKEGPAKSFYLYDPETKVFRGCMPASMFSISGPVVPVTEIPEELPEPVAIMAIHETQQMSFFDFI